MQHDVRQEEITAYGHRVCFKVAGDSGPVLLLIHGITGSSAHWEPIMPLLAQRFIVIAPDLLGHGESAKPRGDYSLGAYATGVRDSRSSAFDSILRTPSADSPSRRPASRSGVGSSPLMP